MSKITSLVICFFRVLPWRSLTIAGLLPLFLLGQTQVDLTSQARNLPVYNVKSFGAKGDGATDDTPAIKTALTSVSTKGGGYLFFPFGTYEISSEIVIPNGVQIVGLGWSSPPEWGAYGTVLQASATFNGHAPFPGNMMLAVDGQSDTFGAGASNLTVDCNLIPGCGGLYRGHANEQTYFKRIDVVNFSSYGFYICGAGENSDAPNVCGGSTNSGAQGDGPDEDLQFYPDKAATPSTIPIFIRSDLSYRGLHNVTVATLSNGTNQPTWGGVFSGSTYNVRNVHIEGPLNGFYLGPLLGPLCPKNCNGLSNAEFDEIDLTRGGTNTITFNSVGNLDLFNILGTITDNKFSQNIVSINTVGYLFVDAFGNVASSDPNFGTTHAGPFTAKNTATFFSSTLPQLVVQNDTGPIFPLVSFGAGADGSMSVGSQGGNGNWLFTTPLAVFSIGANAPYTGLNLQSPTVAGTGNMRGVLCSDLFWNNSAANWTVSNNNASDYSCAHFPAGGGFAISTSNSVSQPGTVTQPQFMSNTHFKVTGSGSLLLGPNASTVADSGQPLQVNGGMQLAPPASIPACTAALRGTFWFLDAAAGAQDHVQVCAQNASGTLGWQQIY